MTELLAPAGNLERLKTAFYFGADAAYLAYKKFGLRAFADNFDLEELQKAVITRTLSEKKSTSLSIFSPGNQTSANLSSFCPNLTKSDRTALS